MVRLVCFLFLTAFVLRPRGFDETIITVVWRTHAPLYDGERRERGRRDTTAAEQNNEPHVFKEVAGCRVDAFGVGADTLGFGYNYYIFMTIIF